MQVLRCIGSSQQDVSGVTFRTSAGAPHRHKCIRTRFPPASWLRFAQTRPFPMEAQGTLDGGCSGLA